MTMMIAIFVVTMTIILMMTIIMVTMLMTMTRTMTEEEEPSCVGEYPQDGHGPQKDACKEKEKVIF